MGAESTVDVLNVSNGVWIKILLKYGVYRNEGLRQHLTSNTVRVEISGCARKFDTGNYCDLF